MTSNISFSATEVKNTSSVNKLPASDDTSVTSVLNSDIHSLPASLNTLTDASDLEVDSAPPAPVPEDEDLEQLPGPRPMEPSYNLAPYLAQSQVLQQLVAMGVNLSVLEKVKEAADFVVQADWDTDIQPRLLFLKDIGVEDAQLGQVLMKNPLVLKDDIEDMKVFGHIMYHLW